MAHVLILVISILISFIITISAAPPGKFKWKHESDCWWAFDCDFPNMGDIGTRRTKGEDCSKACGKKTGCSHFSWNKANGGTCYFKKLARNTKPKRSTWGNQVCGVMHQKVLVASTGSGTSAAAGAVEVATGLVDLALKLAPLFKDRDTYRNKKDNFLFFEGNYCSENLAGSFWDDNRNLKINFKKVAFLENDEARSMLIQGPLRRGNIIWLCDNPHCCNCDDETRIYVKKSIPKGRGYCVHSFEKSFTDKWVVVKHNHKNGLDGKVSQVKNYD